jgi:hypothetical protein
MISSEPSDLYNCAAWAIGDTRHQYWPVPPELAARVYQWPGKLPHDETLAAFADGFGSMGYEKCELADAEAGYDKIAVYALPSGVPTHVARQLENGAWTSKLGDAHDIVHSSLADLECAYYGYIRLVMRRQRGTLPW